MELRIHFDEPVTAEDIRDKCYDIAAEMEEVIEER